MSENDFECFASTGVKSSCERHVRAFGSRPDPRLTTWFSTRGSLNFLSRWNRRL